MRRERRGGMGKRDIRGGEWDEGRTGEEGREKRGEDEEKEWTADPGV